MYSSQSAICLILSMNALHLLISLISPLIQLVIFSMLQLLLFAVPFKSLLSSWSPLLQLWVYYFHLLILYFHVKDSSIDSLSLSYLRQLYLKSLNINHLCLSFQISTEVMLILASFSCLKIINKNHVTIV